MYSELFICDSIWSFKTALRHSEVQYHHGSAIITDIFKWNKSSIAQASKRLWVCEARRAAVPHKASPVNRSACLMCHTKGIIIASIQSRAHYNSSFAPQIKKDEFALCSCVLAFGGQICWACSVNKIRKKKKQNRWQPIFTLITKEDAQKFPAHGTLKPKHQKD